MKNILRIIVIGFATVLSGCGTHQEATHNPESGTNAYGIELVNMEKWEINREMVVHIENMEADIQSISGQSDPNYGELGERLGKNLGLLISSCTMKDRAHDELHKWLHPFIGLVKELNEASSEKAQKASFEAIKTSMHDFNAYFEARS